MAKLSLGNARLTIRNKAIFNSSSLKTNLDKLKQNISNHEAESIKESAKNYVEATEQIAKNVARLVYRDIAKAIDLELLAGLLDEQISNDYWMDINQMVGAKDTGIYGKFIETKFFGSITTGNEPESDMVHLIEDGLGKITNLSYEIKSQIMTGVKDIDIGSVTIQTGNLTTIEREAIDSINGRTALLYYKMLIKMQNFIMFDMVNKEKNGKLYMRFEKLTLYTSLMIEYLFNMLEEIVKDIESKAPTLTGEEKRMISVTEVKGENKIGYKIEINYKKFLGMDSFGNIVNPDAYRELYRNRISLFENPETKKLFYMKVRKLAKAMGRLV